MSTRDTLDGLAKAPEFKYSGPAPGITPEQVWEAMREACHWSLGEACHWSLEECGAPSCAFAACPLLKEEK